MNPPKVFEKGQRQDVGTTKHLLPYSGRLLPEFTKRRSIRDMFQKSSSNGIVKLDSQETVLLNTSGNPDSPTKELHTPYSTQQASLTTNCTESTPTQNGQKRPVTDEPELSVKKKQKIMQKDTKSNTTNQKTLKSFFQPKTPVAEKLTYKGNAMSSGAVTPRDISIQNTIPIKSPKGITTEQQADEDKFIDPFTTRTEWTKLFSKRDPPRCEGHNEPCQKLQTKVKGSNCGRWFWICSRPVGPSGGKENGTQWRCRSFIWASDVGKGN